MLKEEKCYSATCDKCEDIYINGNEFSVFTHVDILIEELDQSGWTNENGQLLCPDCITDYDNVDSINNLPIEPLKIETDATGED